MSARRESPSAKTVEVEPGMRAGFVEDLRRRLMSVETKDEAQDRG